MYNFKLDLDAREHDQFVKASPQVNLLQSSNWAKVKDNWNNLRVGFYKDEELVAAASILIRPLPLGLSIFYIPRGPVMDYNNPELVTFVLEALKKIGKQYKAIFITFDPNLLLKQYHLGQESDENPETLQQLAILQKSGAIWAGRTKNMADTIQPRFQANVYTNQDLTESFPKHTKRLMKDATTRGVQTRRGSIEDLTDFAQVMALTESRKGVSLRNKDYYHKMMSIYGDDAYLHLAKINLKERLADYEKQLEQVENDLAQTAPHQKKRLTKLTQQQTSIQNYIKEFQTFIDKYPDSPTLAGILSVRFGSSMEMLYAGMNDDFKKFYPQYSLYPQVFADAYQDNIHSANMGGVEGDLSDGLTKFKSNFNPMIEEYIGEFELPVNPLLYKAAKWAYKTRQNLRRKH